MKKPHYFLAGSILVALILALVVSVPARADKPPVERGHFEENGILDVCGVEIPFHWQGDLKHTLLCDEKRASCGEVSLWKQKWSLTYNGHSLYIHGSTREHVTWINWYDAKYEISGANLVATVPGHGLVSAVAGKQVVYETCHGDEENWECEYEVLHEPAMEFTDVDTICNYLLYGK